MKLILPFIFFPVVSFASVSGKQVDQQALAILLKNSGKITTQEDGSIADFLAQNLLFEGAIDRQIENHCQLDKEETTFKCELKIFVVLNNEGTMFSAHYFLKKGVDGLPSEEFVSEVVDTFTDTLIKYNGGTEVKYFYRDGKSPI